MNVGVPKPDFTCIRIKAVDNVQGWVNKGSIEIYRKSLIYRKTDDNETLLLSHFVCFNLGHVINVSAQTFLTVYKSQFLAKKFEINTFIFVW